MKTTQTKICNNCKIEKINTSFNKHKRGKFGLRANCKSCDKHENKQHSRTKNGLISIMYSSQKHTSKKRGHSLPSYTKQQLHNWLLDDWLFNLLFSNWRNCGFITEMKPSIDRLNNNIGYSFNNIQITTWRENQFNAYHDMRKGKLTVSRRPQKKVVQCSMDDIYIKEFVSMSEADRMTGIDQASISKCCNMKQKTAGGFTWSYA